ncbi:hypothetical protein Q4Q49_03550 [Shewanella sp. SP1S1-7]|uniref:hypothetical protein n=1 Tax=Shewanella TaxID=22 RepID=UPI00288C7326|nr:MULTISPECIES: hypothetical protein [unclassified Shewanella]MDT3294770.1 hypothetical protein [Shewanella sp. SP2S2-6]MDT3307676.1 hypothetical protein [Shewanella sp. SP1S1-4]MDT3334359.1 hypothetical protein [Shewanella sp. SP1S1-7]
MDIVIPEIAKENAITFGIFLTAALIGVAIKIVRGLIDFYEDVLIKRYFKRLNSLKEHVEVDSTISKYLNSLREYEVFRLASGIRVAPEKAKVLMDIYILGVASNFELKRVSPFLKPENTKILVDVNWIDKLLFTYSFIAAIFLMIAGMLIGFPYFVIGGGAESTTGLFIMVIFVMVAAIVGRDFRTYRILKRVSERLTELDMLINPDEKILWSFDYRSNPS